MWESGEVSLGAVRLKIIDLEHGDQPMASDDGDTILVFNGELYNHMELRRELERAGHRFHSRCDTETVLHAFLEWDIDAFRRFRGMFAAAFWTQSEKRLVLVRDHMGIKPLYFARRRRKYLFRLGAESHPAASGDRAVDRSGGLGGLPLAQLRSRTADAGGGSRKAPAGHLARMARGHGHHAASIGGWSSIPIPSRDLDSAKEELDGLLRSAVREQLVSDVPLGVWSQRRPGFVHDFALRQRDGAAGV